MGEQINTVYKIRYNDTVYKIDKVNGNSLLEIKELYAKKFNLDETALKSYELVAKQEGAENRVLLSDQDVIESLENATINKKGAKVLTIKLREAQIKPEKAKPTFAAWKNLTEGERTALKEQAMAKAKEFYVIETSDESSSDSSIEKHPGKPLLKKLKQVTMEKIKANPELAKNLPALKQVFAEVRGEMKEHMGEFKKCWKGFGFKKCGDRSVSKCGEWGKERWILFKSLCSKYPTFPGWKVGKIMKKNKGLSEAELGAKIQEKLDKFTLQTPEQKHLYDELRKEFPRMPEFCVNKAIIKNEGKDIEKIKKRLYKCREHCRKFKGKFDTRAEICEKKKHLMHGSYSPEKRSWSKDDYELFAWLCEKYPQMPKWKIGKIMKKNRKLSKQELCDKIQKKLDKLDEAGQAKFDELRKDFPHMPEFLIKRVICKNEGADIEKLKKRLEKLKEKGKDCKVKFMKGLFEKMGCMKKKLHKMEKMKDYEGFKPHAYGPIGYGFAPMGYGPHGFGPHGHGPHGFGPHGHGPHGFGPHGFGPHGFGPHGF